MIGGMARVRPNDRCPCGSGRNYKKCCAKKRGRVARYTSADRESALEKLEHVRGEIEADALWRDLGEVFWGEVPVADDEEPAVLAMSDFAFDCWCYFDVDIGGGDRLVDVLLIDDRELGVGERAYLEMASSTSMRPYEITVVRPGQSLTLRDLLDDTVREVRERSASRSLHRWDVIAARVFPIGASGQAELDGGMFPIPPARKESLLLQVRGQLDKLRREEPNLAEIERHKTLVPIYHQAWRLPMAIPKLVNYDGDDLIETRAFFELSGPEAAVKLLDAVPGLARDDASVEKWTWSGIGTNRQEPIVRGWVTRENDRLVLHTNSRERAERGRAMLQEALGELVHHRLTETEDVQRAVEQRLARGGRPTPDSTMHPELREQLTLELEKRYQAHYEHWLDERVPMFDDRTPREAAASPVLRPRVADALKDLERLYERALEQGEPAFDPSWLRDELGIHEDDETRRLHPPPLAHETMGELVPGLAELASQVAERVRRESGGALDRTIDRDDLVSDLALQRFVRAHARAVAKDADNETAVNEAMLLASHVALRANFELHLRKVFWVDEALSWALGTTKLDVTGNLLRVPFASFALVLTDRYALALAEKMISREPGARLRGRMLRVLTVYVTKLDEADDAFGLRVAFGCDALDGDWPYLLARDLRVTPDADLETILDSRWDGSKADDLDPIFACLPLRDLLHLVINAILYATSADARCEERVAPPRRVDAGRATASISSESVFFLPGTIDISALRAIQRARRGSSDSEQVHRCLVRGHWRRANAGWKDDRPRWVEPYWRGPTAAAIVERQYRLEP